MPAAGAPQALEALELVFGILCQATELWTFVSDRPFEALGTTEDELVRSIVTRMLYDGAMDEALTKLFRFLAITGSYYLYLPIKSELPQYLSNALSRERALEAAKRELAVKRTGQLDRFGIQSYDDQSAVQSRAFLWT